MRIRKIACIVLSAVIAVTIGVGVFFATSQNYNEYYEEYAREKTMNTVAFNNKLADSGNDPWVIWHEETLSYYYCYAENGGVCVAQLDNIYDLADAEGVTVWTPETGTSDYSKELWAPELHFINDKWYIYVAADDGDNANHRMLCLEGNGKSPLMSFRYKRVVKAKTDRWAIDGTVLQYDDELYFIWSGWEGTENVSQNLYIAKMSDPWTIEGDRVCISKPAYPWEKVGEPLVNEGPTVIQYKGKVHILYSASGSRTDDYCLGLLTLSGRDPLKENAWKKSEKPVFSKTDEIFGPGHASVTTSPDGSRWYLIYHANEESGTGWAGRSVWAKEFTFDRNEYPVFGKPEPAGNAQHIYENNPKA